MIPTKTEWVPICQVQDIPVLGARRVNRSQGPAVALFRAADDHVFALLDIVTFPKMYCLLPCSKKGLPSLVGPWTIDDIIIHLKVVSLHLFIHSK